MDFTQDNRLIAVDTPLGKDVLLLENFHGVEGLSMPFSFELSLVSLNHNISFSDIIGKNVTISVILEDGSKRFFNGIVSRFSQGRGVAVPQGDPFSYYHATVVPWFWLLTRTADSRIFQKASVIDIVEDLFKEKHKKYNFGDIKMEYRILTHGSYDKRDYCVQYRETDFNFISRLLEEEGIYYFFEHEDGKHTMILADSPQEHKPCPNQEEARYQLSVGGREEDDVITELERTQEIVFGECTLNDFNFEIPGTDLKVKVPSTQKLGPGARELYEYPGSYEKRNEGDRLARIRMEEKEARMTAIHGAGTCRAFTSGYRFTLSDFYRNDMNGKDYVLTSLSHQASQDRNSEAELVYTNTFACIPFDVPYRPAMATPRPFVQGSQTAIVVGPKGEEIYTDKYGRVKVQFHWDREGKKDENSSCWIRVGQIWAGEGWGGIFIPRIGQEVIVEFLEGDPDRPIITGRMYNANQTPPYSLPANATQSGIKSRSSKNGSTQNFNEIRLEDKKGSEQIFVHAERNMDTEVEADETHDVGGDRKMHVKGHFTEDIDSGETRTVKSGASETIHGGMKQTIQGGEIRTISGGARETISGGETRMVDGGTTETINGGETRTVVGGLTETVTGAVTQSVAGGITISATGPVTVAATGGFSVVAPGGTRSVDDFFSSIGMKREDLFAIKTAVLSIQTTIAAMSTSIQGLKIDTTGIKFERCGFKSANNPLTIKTIPTKIKSGAIGLYMFGLTLLQ